MSTKKRQQTEALVLGAIFTALVIVLQLLGSFIRFGVFSISLVLIPIVIGAAKCGVKTGTWLGFVFGVVVLLSGDANSFLTVNAIGTIITVLLKGTACGFAAAVTYKLLSKYNTLVAVIAAAIVCPVVNTGVFLLGCSVFFLETITEWGKGLGFDNAITYMFLGLCGGNFLFELGANIVLSPAIVTVLNTTGKNR